MIVIAYGNAAAIAQSPHDLLARGREKIDREDLEGAIGDLTRYTRLQPNSKIGQNSVYFFSRALCQSGIKKYKLAVDDLNAAIKLNPNIPAAYSERAKV